MPPAHMYQTPNIAQAASRIPAPMGHANEPRRPRATASFTTLAPSDAEFNSHIVPTIKGGKSVR